MREDILKAIRTASDVTNVVVLTHNIDFVFIQCLLLPALRKCGSPALTIFADAQCSEQSYELQHRVLSELGLRYRVVAVPMKEGFRFHPKAILLSGPERASLFVGSGNLTFGGWRENAEVWNRFDTESDGTGPMAAFREYLREVVALCPGPKEAIAREIDEAFDESSKHWAGNMGPPSGLVGRAGQGVSMLEQMRAILGAREPDHAFLCTPYFDENADALKAITTSLCGPSGDVTVLVQSGRTTLMRTAAQALEPRIKLKNATFEHREKIGTNGAERVREPLLHAKLYSFRFGDEAIVFIGSANCSQAALTLSKAQGNAELLAWRVMPFAQFEQSFLAELVIRDVKPVLAEQTELPSATKPDLFIRINTARYETGAIEIICQRSEGLTITQAVVDGVVVELPDVAMDAFAFQCGLAQPRSLELRAFHNDREVRSAPHWIDNESALRTSARSRSVADSIYSSVRQGNWNIGAWADLLGELCKHLDYMPARTIISRSARIVTDQKKSVEFSWSDVFAADYRFPVAALLPRLQISADGRIGGLRCMLLRWFGIADSDEPDESADDLPSEQAPDGNETDKLTPLPKAGQRKVITSTERRRVTRIVTDVASRLSNREFLELRPPELLAADLKIAALLLRTGLCEGWLGEQEFMDATLRIWLPLFFHAEGAEGVGWIKQRFTTAPSQEDFIASFSSVELGAALACWALSIPPTNTPEHSHFALACALSISRLPWLWQVSANEAVAKQVAEVFAHTSQQQVDGIALERRWLTMIRRGYALQMLDGALATVAVSELSKRIKRQSVTAGELLWQGKIGFCVAGSDCDRIPGARCNLLLLSGGQMRRDFSGPLLVPVLGLVDASVVPEANLSEKTQAEITSMMRELADGLRQTAARVKKLSVAAAHSTVSRMS